MHRSLKQEDTWKGTLARTGGQKVGMFGESTGLVDNIPSDAPLGCKSSGTPLEILSCPRGSASCSGKGKSLVQFGLQYHQVFSLLQSGYPSAARLRFFRLLDSVPYFPG
jgi:hypothetical protein